MPRRSALLIALLAAVAVAAVAAVALLRGGGDADDPAPAKAAPDPPRGTVTVYASLPLTGAAEFPAGQIRAGAELALERAGGRAGAFRVRLRPLDSGSARLAWVREEVERNARKAARDPSAIGYLGEFHSAATTYSLPVLNRAGLAQVTPANTATYLTRKGPGGWREAPEGYYPTGLRTFVRVVPADHIQAAALVRLADDLGARRPAVVRDASPYGVSLAGLVAGALRKQGRSVATRATLRPNGRNAAAVAQRMRRAGAESLIYAGVDGPGAAKLFNTVRKAVPGGYLLAGDGVATEEFTKPLDGTTATFTRITSPTAEPEAYPDAAQPVAQALRERTGTGPSAYGLFGYEAMALLLEAIERAGDRGDVRGAVVEKLMAIRERDSILGRYEIDRNGDTTLPLYGVYGVNYGRLEFDSAIDPFGSG